MLAGATTSGQWWRLVTALAVQPSLAHLACIIVLLLSGGRVLERLDAIATDDVQKLKRRLSEHAPRQRTTC